MLYGISNGRSDIYLGPRLSKTVRDISVIFDFSDIMDNDKLVVLIYAFDEYMEWFFVMDFCLFFGEITK